MYQKDTKAEIGFTLLELLVALIIILMLTGVVVPQIMIHREESKIKAAQAQIEEIMTALDMYKRDLGSYPTTEQGLTMLIAANDSVKYWNGPYLRKPEIPLDPWQNKYMYVYPGKHGSFDLYSLGADGKEGGENENRDILGWK